MCTAFAFIVAEYCTQSHLSTVDYEKSRQGLRWTRWFRKYTYLFRSIPHMCIGSGMNLWLRIMGKRASHERRSLSWTWKTKEQGLPALEDQGSNLQLSGGSRSRENDDASESDDSGEPGDILMGPLELAPVSVQEGRVGVGHYIWWRRREQWLSDILMIFWAWERSLSNNDGGWATLSCRLTKFRQVSVCHTLFMFPALWSWLHLLLDNEGAVFTHHLTRVLLLDLCSIA